MTNQYLSSATVGLGMGGYAFAYADSLNGGTGTSSICLRTDALCAKGTTDVADTMGKLYGAGIGFSINQAESTNCSSTTINTFTVPANSVGISYSLSNLPLGGARIAIGNGTTDYCATLTAASGVVAWSKFNTACWSPSTGTALSGPPTGPTQIEFQLPSSNTTQNFDFCVDSVAFATSLSTDAGSGGGTPCSGSSCCAASSGPSTSNGELTCYTFAQAGSPPIGTNLYKSYCGYTVSEAAGGGGGNGICQTGQLNYTDTVQSNIGTNPQYFVAFPTGNSGWGNGTYCGMCVNVTYQGKTLMATVVDECPTGTCPSNGGHLDLNGALARALNLGTTGTGDATSGVTWDAVECPVTGNIQAVWNGTPAGGQVYFQNVVWPIKSVSGATQSNGIWSTVANGSTHTLTDTLGHQVTAVITSGDLGVQFPRSCQ
jgi:hypothetical protein